MHSHQIVEEMTQTPTLPRGNMLRPYYNQNCALRVTKSKYHRWIHFPNTYQRKSQHPVRINAWYGYCSRVLMVLSYRNSSITN